jgi:hypothetical protein
MDLNNAKSQLLSEAAASNNQLFKVDNLDGVYVKGFSIPIELRELFVAGLDSLLQEGEITSLFTNAQLQVFGLTAGSSMLVTVKSAKLRILQEIQDHIHIYKIHSSAGEFVQCACENFDHYDSSRIVFLRALGDLLHSGEIDVVSECREMCVYKIAG